MASPALKPGTAYFPDLDGIRAFACLFVFTGHMFDYFNGRKLTNVIEQWIYEHIINGAGAMGVSLFFVLSGFLITWLLITEKEKTGKILLKNFYLKRILRIWPLFFAVVIAAFFIVPLFSGGLNSEGIRQHLPWFGLFANNFDRVYTGFKGFNNDSPGVLWSVAVEEQFYLFWPLILLLSPKKIMPYILWLIIAGSFVFRYYHRHSADYLFYHSFSVAGDLAIGGMVAWLGFYKENFRKTLQNKMVKIAGYVFLFAVLLNHHVLLSAGDWAASGRLALTIGFSFLIADQSLGTKGRWRISRFKNLSRLGWISYGFYCLHLFVIMLFQKLNHHFGIQEISAPLFYAEFAAIFAVTTLLSFLSYRYFEGYFRKMRNRLQLQNE
jgi:peptidoglycan/LPS O-acetylase OafA/YrhL